MFVQFIYISHSVNNAVLLVNFINFKNQIKVESAKYYKYNDQHWQKEKITVLGLTLVTCHNQTVFITFYTNFN